MIDEKEYVSIFFNYIYSYIQKIIKADNKYSATNLGYFQKLYENMTEAFAISEDASCINWKRMWNYLFLLQIMDSETEEKETDLFQDMFAKNDVGVKSTPSLSFSSLTTE